MKTRGTSVVPLIMGIIGAVIQLPGAVCAGACAAGMTAFAEKSQSAVNDSASTFMYLGLLAVLLGFVGGLLGKGKPTLSGILLLAATVLSGLTLVTFNFFSLIPVVLFLIGGIFAFVQKKEEVQV